jgi:transcriptional regulator with XRE-family HTH domain
LKSTHLPAYRTFVDRLIAAREAVGCTQSELGLRLGRPQSYVSKVETLERRLDIVEFVHWANALKVEPVDLFKSIADGIGKRRRGVFG